MNENPLQGSFVIDELTDLVEEAVLTEFDAIAAVAVLVQYIRHFNDH